MAAEMTEGMVNLLGILKRQFGTKAKGGWIPLRALDCYDWRRTNGLMARGHIVLQQRGVDDLPGYRLAEQHRKG